MLQPFLIPNCLYQLPEDAREGKILWITINWCNDSVSPRIPLSNREITMRKKGTTRVALNSAILIPSPFLWATDNPVQFTAALKRLQVSAGVGKAQRSLGTEESERSGELLFHNLASAPKPGGCFGMGSTPSKTQNFNHRNEGPPLDPSLENSLSLTVVHRLPKKANFGFKSLRQCVNDSVKSWL